MNKKNAALLGWISGQLHDAAASAELSGSRDNDTALFISVVLRRLSAEIEGLVVKKAPTAMDIELARPQDIH